MTTLKLFSKFTMLVIIAIILVEGVFVSHEAKASNEEYVDDTEMTIQFVFVMNRKALVKQHYAIYEHMFSGRTDNTLEATFDARLDKCIVYTLSPLHPSHNYYKSAGFAVGACTKVWVARLNPSKKHWRRHAGE